MPGMSVTATLEKPYCETFSAPGNTCPASSGFMPRLSLARTFGVQPSFLVPSAATVSGGTAAAATPGSAAASDRVTRRAGKVLRMKDVMEFSSFPWEVESIPPVRRGTRPDVAPPPREGRYVATVAQDRKFR